MQLGRIFLSRRLRRCGGALFLTLDVNLDACENDAPQSLQIDIHVTPRPCFISYIDAVGAYSIGYYLISHKHHCVGVFDPRFCVAALHKCAALSLIEINNTLEFLNTGFLCSSGMTIFTRAIVKFYSL